MSRFCGESVILIRKSKRKIHALWLREKDSETPSAKRLLAGRNRQSSPVRWYKGSGEKRILHAFRTAIRRRLRSSPSREIGENGGIFWGVGKFLRVMMAERVGFEPTVQFPAHTLSKRAP